MRVTRCQPAGGASHTAARSCAARVGGHHVGKRYGDDARRAWRGRDDDLGEEVGAAVALKDGYDVDSEELQAFAKERLAAYKYPRSVWIVDELPKGPTGKILRREVEAPGGAKA